MAAGALVLLLSAGVIAPIVAAREAAGGGNHPGDDEDFAPRAAPRPTASGTGPLGWLRHSSHTFQILMDRLAERSAGINEPDLPPRPYRPPSRVEGGEPLPGTPVRSDGEPTWDWRRRSGEATGGGTSSPVDADRWPKAKDRWPDDDRDRWPDDSERGPKRRHCRHAGEPVKGAGWYVVEAGDTLWSIAEVHYGYGGAYWRIYRANRDILDDAGTIHRCQRLYIPHWRWCGCRKRD